jgi:hypothetical protein
MISDAIYVGIINRFTKQVLVKLPVVQHIVFGRLFHATWTPSVHASPVAGGPAVTVPPSNNSQV